MREKTTEMAEIKGNVNDLIAKELLSSECIDKLRIYPARFYGINIMIYQPTLSNGHVRSVQQQTAARKTSRYSRIGHVLRQNSLGFREGK